MNKRVLISLILIAVIAFGGGIGTLAYFTAQAASTDNVYEVGIFQISGSTQKDLGKIFEQKDFTGQPGMESKTKEVTIKNTGTLPMRIYAQVDWKVVQARDKDAKPINPKNIFTTVAGNLNSPFVKMFEIKPILTNYDAEGNLVKTHNEEGKWMKIEGFQAWMNNIIDGGKQFKPGYSYKLNFQIRLSEKAENEYQGSTVEATMIINGEQMNSPTGAFVNGILIDGEPLAGFDPDQNTYVVSLEDDTDVAPQVSAIAGSNVTVIYKQAVLANGMGTAKVVATVHDSLKYTYTINFVVAQSDVAYLEDLCYGGETVPGFDGIGTFDYDVTLPYGTTVIPEVTADAVDDDATVDIVQADSLPGAATVTVTSEDGSNTKTYTINFTVAKNNDATLSSLKVGGVEVLAAGVDSYAIELPHGTSVVPSITAVATDSNASVLINTGSIPGATTITVTAEDGVTTKTYTINFTVKQLSADATLSDLKVDGTTIAGFNQNTTTYNFTAPYMNVIPQVSATKNDPKASVSITQASAVKDGVASVVVTAENGDTKTYNVNFRPEATPNGTVKYKGLVSGHDITVRNYTDTSSGQLRAEVTCPNSDRDLRLYLRNNPSLSYGQRRVDKNGSSNAETIVWTFDVPSEWGKDFYFSVVKETSPHETTLLGYQLWNFDWSFNQ